MVSPAALSRQRRAQPPAARPYAETFHDRGDPRSHYAWIATAITDSGRGSALSGGSGRMISHGGQPAPCAGCRLHHAGDGTRHHRTAAWPHRGRPAAPAPAQRTTTAGRTAWARRASPLRDPGSAPVGPAETQSEHLTSWLVLLVGFWPTSPRAAVSARRPSQGRALGTPQGVVGVPGSSKPCSGPPTMTGCPSYSPAIAFTVSPGGSEPVSEPCQGAL